MAPPLLPIFRSRAQLAVLIELFTGAAPEHSIGELAARTGVPQATVSREVARLVAAGLLADREVGRTRLVRAQVESPIHVELTALLLKVNPHRVGRGHLRFRPGRTRLTPRAHRPASVNAARPDVAALLRAGRLQLVSAAAVTRR